MTKKNPKKADDKEKTKKEDKEKNEKEPAIENKKKNMGDRKVSEEDERKDKDKKRKFGCFNFGRSSSAFDFSSADFHPAPLAKSKSKDSLIGESPRSSHNHDRFAQVKRKRSIGPDLPPQLTSSP